MDLTLNLNSGDFTIDPSFEGHLGRRIIKKLKEHSNLIHQIDLNTDEKETHGSVRLRSIRVAQALRTRTWNTSDVVVICSVYHNDACIPFISSLYLGLAPLCLTPGLTHAEFKHTLGTSQPKFLFLDSNIAEDINKILIELNIDAEIITFGRSDNENFSLFSELSKATGTEESFVCEDFDPETTTAFVICSSGTTGLPKLVAFSHKTTVMQLIIPVMHLRKETDVPITFVGYKVICFSPMYWVSTIFIICGTSLFGCTHVKSSLLYDPEVAKKVIENYKPDALVMSSVGIYSLAKHLNEDNSKMYNIRNAYIGGSALHSDSVKDFQNCIPNGNILAMYGSTETGIVLTNPGFNHGTLGQMKPWVKWKVVDYDTDEILGPNKIGELRVKSFQQFQKYLNNPKATEDAYDSDNYFKTGDMFYYDEAQNLYFVDRCKELIKYLHYRIASVELERVIYKLPEVLCVGVVGLQDASVGELPMAFVQLAPGTTLTAQAVKDVVKNNLSDDKQLRGGVVFLDKIVLTPSGKINRKILNELKFTMKGE